MTGSVIDGEDVLQDALAKAFEALPSAGPIANPEGWLFRIAHNAALDFLRRRTREKTFAEEDPDMIVDPANPTIDRQAASAALHSFMRLPIAQRSSVIMMDVLGYSLQEISATFDISIPAVKAALHRGRDRLRQIADEPDDRPLPRLGVAERQLLNAYIDRFNARDFDAVRDMLAQEVRLELVARTRLNGKREAGTYFGNYSRVQDWRLGPGLVENRPAILVRDPNDPAARPTYFILVAWQGGRLAGIRDFRHARYVADGAKLLAL